MSKNEFGTDVRLRILVLDGLKSLILVVTQRSLDVVKTGGLDVIDVVSEEHRILHGVHCASTAAWKKLELKEIETNEWLLEGYAGSVYMIYNFFLPGSLCLLPCVQLHLRNMRKRQKDQYIS